VDAAPLVVAGPSPLRQFLDECAELDDRLAGKYAFVDNHDMRPPQQTPLGGGGAAGGRAEAGSKKTAQWSHTYTSVLNGALERLGVSTAVAVNVEHCYKAYGLVVTHRDGWKLVYSGDTEPCDRLVEAGKGATVLIHEATLQDGKELDARYKRHSTMSEAIQVGERMGAHRILLTHFSQRYPKLPVSSSAGQDRVVFAYDLMRLRFEQLKWAPRLLPGMRALFDSPAGDENLSDEEAGVVVVAAAKQQDQDQQQKKTRQR